MGIEILHTPWRRKYVVGARETDGCVFCNLLEDDRTDQQRYILCRSEIGFLLLNLYPYTPGHLMAIPYRHLASTLELEAKELVKLMTLCRLGERLLRRAYGCRSIHVGANLGEAAGAGVPGHLHFHIVAWPQQPLWDNCKSEEEAPESVSETYERLKLLLPEIGDLD